MIEFNDVSSLDDSDWLRGGWKLCDRCHISYMSRYSNIDWINMDLLKYLLSGYAYFISAIGFCKVGYLSWMFAKVIRRQMNYLLEITEKYETFFFEHLKGIFSVSRRREDMERTTLRSQLSLKGKIRLGRVFGSYNS